MRPILTSLIVALLIGVAAPPLRAQASAAATARPRHAAEIGEALGPAEYTFHRITDVAVDGWGRVYVLDGGERLVKVYESSGEFLAGFGREGGGPGEFVRPVEVVVGPDDVRVLDAAQGRSSVFGYDGEHVRTMRYPERSPANAGRVYTLRGGARLAVTTARFALRGESDPYARLVIVPPDGSPPDSIAAQRSGAVVWYERERRLPWGVAESPFGDGGAWALSGDSLLAVVDGYGGEIVFHRVSDDGRLMAAARIRLDGRGRPITEDDLATLERRLRAERRAQGRSLPRELGFAAPEHRSAVTGGAFFSAEGVLWVEMNEVDDDDRRTWRRFGADGAVFEPVCVPAAFRVEAARADRLYGVWRSELDVETVRVYELASS